ncbi:hypothetical protein FOBRF1_006727 [Fusarium oxysporum]
MPTPVPHDCPGSPRPARRTRTARSKYVPRACQECHRRRAKCDGQKPSCSRCLARGLSCAFSTNVDHRGSAPRSYVSLLQTRIALLEQVLRLHQIDIDTSIAQITAQKPESDAELPRGCQLLPPSDRESQKDSESASYRQPASGDPAYGECDAPFFGATSGRLELPTRPDAGLRSYSNNPHILKSPDKLEITTQNYIQKPVSLDPQPLAQDLIKSTELHEHLIDLYFAWEQPWLQVVDEALFRDSRRSNGRYHSALLLDCIMALASRYSNRPEVRSDPRDPNTAGMAFIQSAEARLQGELKWPRITTVQSLAIMAIFYVAVGSDAAGWLHHGMAIRLVLDMGLNLDSIADAGLSRLPDAEVQLRRQIYWSLYCSDKLWASYTGRICTMLDSQGSVLLMENVALNGSLSDPLSTSGHSRSFLALFLRCLSTQCQILEKILTNLYAPKGLETAQKRQLFFDNCFLDLQNWLFALPKELKVNPDQPNASPHVYILNMCFHTCIILLAKPFLPNPANSPQSNREQLVLGACRQAAKDICHLGNRYRAAFGSFRRSPLTATHCTLTAALMTIFLANGNRGDLGCCVLILGELADSWAPAKRYWQTLSRVLGDRHGSKGRTERAGSRVDRQDVHDMTGHSQGWHSADLSPDVSTQPTDLLLGWLDDGTFDTTPSLDFSQVDLEQLDFGPLSVLPLDYLNYNAPSFDFQWVPQI